MTRTSSTNTKILVPSPSRLLILDDLLITFDNQRTKAILPQLSAVAKRTQVFLFTHHEHFIDLCHETLGNDQFNLHRLNGHENTS